MRRRDKAAKGRVRIFLDEFERDGLFVLAASIVPEAQLGRLAERWTSLRKRIKARLLQDYPRSWTHAHLQGENLPEVHAVDLFQSKGYYRQDNPQNPEYWKQHYLWIEEALDIPRRHGVKTFYFVADRAGVDALHQSEGHNFDRIFSILQKYSRVMKKIRSLLKNPYITSFAITLSLINIYLEGKGLHGEIICDDKDEAKGFSLLEGYSALKRHGLFNSLSAPKFSDGLSEPLLQMTDVLCYVYGRSIHSAHTGQSAPDEIRKWFTERVYPHALDLLYNNDPREASVATVMLLELLAVHSGAPLAERERFLKVLDHIVKISLEPGQDT